jgi:hypothetical protein
MRTLIFFIPLVLFSTSPLYAAMYKQVDEQGNVTYSDKPSKQGDKPINPPPATTYKPLTVPSQPKKPAETDRNTESATQYQALQITQPTDNESVRANGGSFPLQLTITPDFDEKSHRIVILVDNVQHQEANAISFDLTNMDRGTHSIQAQVRDHDGKILISSNTITIHVLRQSIAPQPRPAKR